MRIVNDTRGFVVNPGLMAVKRYRSMGVIVPPVIRPALLTDSLRGGCGSCGCGGGCDGLAGPPGLGNLGQIDPASLALEINTMVASARAFWNSLVVALGIHAGSREANVITPMQDQITHSILEPCVNMGTNPQNFSCVDLRKMLGVVQQARIEFKAYLTNTQWQDGRAAQQALVWLEGPLPASTSGAWFHQVESDFTGTVQRKCGAAGGGATPIPPGGNVTGSSALIPVLMGAAFFLMRR